MLTKLAELENSGLKDPLTGFDIYISTKVRKFWRQTFVEFSKTRNEELNRVIAKKFSEMDKVARKIPLKNSSDVEMKNEWAEIRNLKGTTQFFVSGVRSGVISVFTVQTGWKRQPGSKSGGSSKEQRQTGYRDPVTGFEIYIMLTVRKKWRERFPETAKMRNEDLNKIIAKEFVDSTDNVIKKLKLFASADTSLQREWAEIRKLKSHELYFISGAKEGKIYIFSIQTSYMKGKKK
jgi:hypothetical protein